VVNKWNKLDQQIVRATSLNAFKNGLDKLRKTKMYSSAKLYASLIGVSASEATQAELQGEYL